MNETSLSLLGRIRQSDDADSWNRLLDLYTPLIRSWLRKYEVESNDAEDLLQEVFATVAQEFPNFEHNQRTGAFRNWLRKILVFRLQNYWRGRKRLPKAKGGSSILGQLDLLEDGSSELSQLWNEQHDRNVVSRLMDLVKPRFQNSTWEAFRRQMFMNQKPEQIAKDLDIGVGSVYMARNRVLAALRAEAEGLVDSL